MNFTAQVRGLKIESKKVFKLRKNFNIQYRNLGGFRIRARPYLRPLMIIKRPLYVILL